MRKIYFVLICLCQLIVSQGQNLLNNPESIVYDENRTMPISTLLTNYLGESDVCLSIPVTVGKKGISRILKPQLNDHEMDAFHQSAKFVRTQIEKLKQKK